MKFNVYVVCFIAILSATLVKSDYAQVKAEQSLLNYLLSPNVISAAADPAATGACFSKFLPVLSEIGTTFSTEYQACLTLAQQRITALTDAAEGNRTSFMRSTQEICANYQTCNAATEILQFFDCYASASEEDVSVVYAVQTNATSAAAALSQGLKLVQEEQNTCTNTTEETYVKNTAATYKLLDSCLAAAGASTLAPITVPPIQTYVKNVIAEQKDYTDKNGVIKVNLVNGLQKDYKRRSQNTVNDSQSPSRFDSGAQS